MEGPFSGKTLFTFGRLAGQFFLASSFIHGNTISSLSSLAYRGYDDPPWHLRDSGLRINLLPGHFSPSNCERTKISSLLN
jgi:hypothetical protein